VSRNTSAKCCISDAGVWNVVAPRPLFSPRSPKVTGTQPVSVSVGRFVDKLASSTSTSFRWPAPDTSGTPCLFKNRGAPRREGGTRRVAPVDDSLPPPRGGSAARTTAAATTMVPRGLREDAPCVARSAHPVRKSRAGLHKSRKKAASPSSGIGALERTTLRARALSIVL
jgi:hypothetical protein